MKTITTSWPIERHVELLLQGFDKLNERILDRPRRQRASGVVTRRLASLAKRVDTLTINAANVRP